jgi:outer membrane protein assembly factor BamB
MNKQMSSFGRLMTVSIVACGVLVACGQREKVLLGERLDLHAPLLPVGETAPETEKESIRIDKLNLATPVINAEWTHRNGSTQHLIRQPALGRSLTKIWTAAIGNGNSRKYAITASPIVGAGRIYTMDSNMGVRAFTPDGAPLWAVDLTPPNEKTKEASGGGLAFDNGTLAVTTWHGEVLALDPATGAVRWRHQMTGAISSDPLILGDTIVAISRSNVALGLDIKDGRILWQQISTGDAAGIAGAGAPAALGQLTVLPFASGEIVGAVTNNGLRAWSASVSGGNKGIARAIVSDISGDPVIDGRTIYVANQTGRLAALDRRSGERIWTANDGSYSPVWPAGGAVFMVTDQFAVKRLNASDGTEVWSAELPGFKTDRVRRQRDTYAYFGPVLAGSQLWVAGSDGLLRSYNPEDGSLTGTVDIPGGAASQPAIAGGRLYILSANGQLHAFQ